MRKYLLLLLLVPQMLTAQNQYKADSLKFEMIRATVEFYTNDGKAFQQLKSIPYKCNQLDYACLMDYADSSHLTGVSAKVKKWRDTSTNNEKDLLALKGTILADLTKDDKSYRTQLPGYDEYIKKLTFLADGLTSNEGTTSTVLTDTGNNKINIKTDSSQEKNGSTTGAGDPSGKLKTLAALIISIVAFIFSLLSFIRSKPKTPVTTALPGSHKDEEDLKKIEDRVDKLNTRLQTKADVNAVNALSEQVQFIRTRIEEQNRPAETREPEIVTPIELKIDTSPESFISFAKFPNLPDGFSDEVLKKEQNGEQVYEITITGNKAVYAISTHGGAQDYALNDFNYILGKACTFNNQPFSGCRISTIKKGTLTKSTAGWTIESRAVIEFR